MRAVGIALALMLASGTAAAQDDDPVNDDPLFAEQGEESVSGVSWLGDLLLRRDTVNGLPNREPVDRLRARGRFGVRYTSDAWEFGVTAEASQGSDANKDNRRNNDNERSDDANLDEAYARWSPTESTALLLGKTRFPLSLTPLVWDDDLRPVGISAEHSIAFGDANRLRLVGGWFAGDHLYGDDSRIAAVQAAWHFNEDAAWSGEISIGYLDFDDLEDIAREGLARTNRRVGTRLVSDYELLDLQFAVRSNAWEVPLEARLDLVRNYGADDKRDGARISSVFGTADVADSWELGLAYERIERDAVMAAFNSDDWWFHSFMRGFMPWVGYGITDNLSVRVMGFVERRDGHTDDVDRLLIDVRATW